MVFYPNGRKNLNSDSFFCPCRGCLVNLNRIHFIKDNELIMSNNEKIPLSRRQEKMNFGVFSQRNYYLLIKFVRREKRMLDII